MRDHEVAMEVYVNLALISEQMNQAQVGDRVLLLAAVEACRAGWPNVAARCRERLIARHPAHQITHHSDVANALRDKDFQQLVARWERYCPFEKAEAMLRQLDRPPNDSTSTSLGDQMLNLLRDP